MATLKSKSFATLVGDFAAAVQGSSSKLVDFTIGSVLRAVAEASGGVALWLQGLAFQILTASRLSTSIGDDCDSFVNDFGLTRIGATAATGLVTFSRQTPTFQSVIPVGAQVATTDGSQSYLVVDDPTNNAYAPGANNGRPGYILAAAVTSVDVPVRAINPGKQGNVVAGAITLLQSSISGVDAVTNAIAVATGADQETDAQLRRRFLLFIASLARSTNAAIGFALTSLQGGIEYTIVENKQYDGQFDAGYLTIVIDDGSGYPLTSLIDRARLAVDAYRAAGVRFGVFPPQVVIASVSWAIETDLGWDRNTVAAQTVSAVTQYVNSLGLGNPLRWSRLEQVIYNTSPGITNVTSLTVNGSQSDIVATKLQTILPGTMTAS